MSFANVMASRTMMPKTDHNTFNLPFASAMLL